MQEQITIDVNTGRNDNSTLHAGVAELADATDSKSVGS